MATGRGHRALPSPAALWRRRGRAFGHDPKAAQDDPLDRQARLRVARQRFVAHGLAHLKAPHFVAGLLGNGFVYVGGHGDVRQPL